MKDRQKTNNAPRLLVLMILFLLLLNLCFGYLMMKESESRIINLMRTRMLDISNTAAAMIDGDVLRTVTPADQGTEGYETIMRTLIYFQDNIDLKYIYCIRDMGDGTFSFGLDPSEDPGEFGSPIVYTEALNRAAHGIAAADETYYEDAWGRFYSAYSPVFDSDGKVAGIIGVDFSADWYDRQLAVLNWTTILVGALSLTLGGVILMTVVRRNRERVASIHGQLNDMQTALMQEMGSAPSSRNTDASAEDTENTATIDALEKQIQSMQTELKSQIAQVHGQAYQDALTGVKSNQAYLEAEAEFNRKIQSGELKELAVVVCDVNGLKRINDTLGHKAGDEYILRSCRMICDVFAHSPVYRVGGDEFTALLSGRDFENRKSLMHELHRRSSSHIATEEAIVSGGLSEYIPGKDASVRAVFERADAAMYEEKMLLKNLGAAVREDPKEEENRTGDWEDILFVSPRCHILIADDVESNREILGDLLQEDYDVYYAADGVETMKILREHRNEIAVVLLDLYMPNMSGREVIREMQIDPELMSVPVIVLTVDSDAEVDSLKIGAMDFIPKPYPDVEIIKARISKCIELSENRDLIRFTRRDKLTGLFNIEYFFRYVKRFDRQNSNVPMDAFVCDINQFRRVNEQYGRRFGDLILHSIGVSFKKLVRKAGGIGGRQGVDTFLMYCPHREDYSQLIEWFMNDLYVEEETAAKAELRFGLYENAEQEEDVEERFARAKSAADSVEFDAEKKLGVFDTLNGQ